MKIAYILGLLLSFFNPLKTAMSQSPDEFWQEYQSAKQRGLVKNATQHLKNLSIRQDSDTLERLEYKKSAILWFVATGGKNGFRKKPAKPEERLIMENALIFASIVQEARAPQSFLSILTLRRKAGVSTETDKVKTHLVKAQQIIAATRIMFHSSETSEVLGSYIQGIFNQEYIGLVFYLKGIKSISSTLWRQEAQELANLFTTDIDKRIKTNTFSNIQFRFNNPAAYLGLKEPVTEATASAFRRFIIEHCTPDPELFSARSTLSTRVAPSPNIKGAYRPFRVVTANGTVITRNADRFLLLQRGNLTIKAGKGYRDNDLCLNKEQTDEEFLAAINAYSAITEKAFI